jgi:hypothetical protein
MICCEDRADQSGSEIFHADDRIMGRTGRYERIFADNLGRVAEKRLSYSAFGLCRTVFLRL